MKTNEKLLDRGKRSAWQFILIVILFIFPVLMIFFNGSRAILGITWGMPVPIKSPGKVIRDENSRPTDPSKKREKQILFGVYDPDGRFRESKSLDAEQIFFSWINPDEKTLAQKLNEISIHKRTPVITIEPWNGSQSEKSLMEDIVKGVYDENISKAIKILSGFPGKFYISWGHEMDQDLTKRYPWSGTDPGKYISAFRYVADKINNGLPNKAKWIWSPVGKKGCDRYWPGPDYVDFIGIPVYSYPKWDKGFYGNIRSFNSWFDEKYKLIQQFNKPVIIVELGVTGCPDYQTFWLQEAFDNLRSNPSVEMVVFFQAADASGSWGSNIEAPDWRSDPGMIIGFVDWMKKND